MFGRLQKTKKSRKINIHLPNGEFIKRAVKDEMLGNWGFQIVKYKTREYLVDKDDTGNYVLGKLLAKKEKRDRK